MKKKVALAFGITGSYTDILANVLIGLKKHSKKFWNDIVVFHSGINAEQQKYLNKITKCNFIELEERDFLKYVKKEQIELYSVATFFRFESFGLLDEYEKVIWSDVDVLFQKDLSSLLKYGDKSGYAATYATSEYKVENNFFELIPEYNMFTKMINAGLFVISDKLKNYKEIQKWCYESTVKYGDNLRWLDQAILNIMVQEFEIDVEEIDLNEYHCHPTFEKYRENATIVHAHGTRKFWNDVEFQTLFGEWYENHQEWLKIYPHEQAGFIYDKLPLVSVVMSVYNRYDFLEDAVNSILDQTYKNLELIIVIEKTECQKEINDFLKKFTDKRLILINNKEKLGFSASLNIGIEASRGKYIARMDDDDISLPTRIAKQVQFMEDNKEIGICDTNAEFFMNSSGLWYHTNPSSEEIKTLLLVLNPLCHPSVMMRKSMLDEFDLRYDPDYFSEDYELWSRAVLYFPIAHIDEVLLKYRASNFNITRSPDSNNKIKESVKKTMKHQFEEYLGLTLTDNELELLQKQTNVLNNSPCYESALKLKQETINKIIKRNLEVNFYNQTLLETLFEVPIEKKSTKSHLKRLTKKMLKPICKPIYNALERRLRAIVVEEANSLENKMNYLIYMEEAKERRHEEK